MTHKKLQSVHLSKMDLRMRYVVTLFLLLLPTASTLADDSETNPVAKKIKSTLQKKVDKQFDQYDGYCDLMIEMEHKGKVAIVKRVTGSGDTKVCRFARSNLKSGKRYRYKHPEKYIRIHITTGS
ncbi:hypothetical protein CGH21_21605 [Vibrio parahaemolyticus]|nr:hypothetical protein [Vibrio parahaemolyticus]TOM93699.1 hypothetical protein CGH66_24580 [Vibrio parahaemolyticus]TON06997.1 hypothetical protein CGH67_10920 [Vibrio parahaemolyticus]TOO10200.1 hypothetical protein CGH43_21905 [Vibrio parahaemolyticus]TOO19058.1 hypothetical protein CGH42_22520 [Vibrio parahaemolyticus]